MRDTVGTDGGDDSVVVGRVGIPERTVAPQDCDVADAGGGQVRPCIGDEVVVDVDRCDVAEGSDQVAEQSGVVAGARTELEDVVARLDLELLEHQPDDARLRGATDGGSVLGALDVDRRVGVGLFEGRVGDEEVAGHGLHGFFDGRRAYAALGYHLVDQAVAQAVGGGELIGRGVVHRVEASGLGVCSGRRHSAVVGSHGYFSR